jgi:hypothetical protein
MIINPTYESWNGRRCTGSALILTVVLTSLLAIVGVLFLMAARIDKMATSATADNRQLGYAVDTVVAQISEVLAKDVPTSSPTEELYDYPDANNPWLADLEPYAVLSTARSTPKNKKYDYFWRQISNITGRPIGKTNDVRALTVGEREPIRSSMSADADGDGVGDARWFQVQGLSSGKGKPIYAAVRIVDNGGMLNVNTGDRFDRTDPNKPDIDGHSQLHVNIMALAAPPGVAPVDANEMELRRMRAFTTGAAQDFAAYEQEVTWQYELPNLLRYTPFDLSDELELRYRYLLNHTAIDTRVEDWGWFRKRTISTPVDTDGNDLDHWYIRTTGVDPKKPFDPCTFVFDPNYAYRHIATAHNLDRILTPKPVPVTAGMEPRKMINVNGTDEYTLSQVVAMALAGRTRVDPAQIVANILDYIDEDDVVTPLGGTLASSPYHGFERPCIYLSELAYKFVRISSTEVHRSYAIELCKPYFEDNDPDPDPTRSEWRLRLGGTVIQMITWSGTRQFHVLLSEDSQAPLQAGYLSFQDLSQPPNAALPPGYDPAKYKNPSTQTLDSAGFKEDTVIELQRKAVWNGRDDWFTVDLKKVPAVLMKDSEDGTVHRLQRDISPEHCILRLWGLPTSPRASLGNAEENFVSTDQRKLQAHPANRLLTNIGELGQIFAENAYGMPDPDVLAPPETSFLIDLANPVFQDLFNYLTVMDPVSHNSNLQPTEMRVKGRVNINTAPPFVLAQLPWMQYRYDGSQKAVVNTFRRALEIVKYRDQYGAFESIAGLMQVPRMGELKDDLINNLFDVTPPTARGPDLTFDTVTDDTEERDLIFTRISNLVTVRSDVFTAYILVRIGLDGPQKRVVAILDRGLTTSASDPVRVLSLEQAPDPR